MTCNRLLWMWVLSSSVMFFDEPSSRLSSWTWSSWIRTVFSTMPSRSPAIFSAKNRCHSLSVNVMRLSPSSWVRRFATKSASDVTGRYSYACSRSSRTSSASSSASDWYRVASAGSASNSATTVDSDDTAIGSNRATAPSLTQQPP